MPEKETLQRAHKDQAEGKSPSTQAGEFVREEMHHVREGKHGARSSKQAIAIGLSKARRAGVRLPPPKKGRASASVREKAQREMRKRRRQPSAKRSRSITRALKREGHAAASRRSLSRQAHQASRKRGRTDRHQAAMKAVRTKGKVGLQQAAKKAARTRTSRRHAA